MKNVQFGESLTGDLKEGTWIFEMQEDFKLRAGVFAIVDKEIYDSILSEGNKIKKQRDELIKEISKMPQDPKSYADYYKSRNKLFKIIQSIEQNK